MHLNQQSCVIFSIFARTSSSKDNYFFRSGYKSTMQRFLQKQTRTLPPPHTHTDTHAQFFQPRAPELETEFRPFLRSKPLCSQTGPARPTPTWSQLNVKALLPPPQPHPLMPLPSLRRGVCQDAVGGLLRPPARSQSVKVVVWPLFVFHLVRLPNSVSTPPHRGPSFFYLLLASPPWPVPGDTPGRGASEGKALLCCHRWL